MSMLLGIVYCIFMMLVLFGVTIFIHELGHFFVARRLGMQADVFSIGFGSPIWKKEHGGVLYKVGWIPFGGYVALPQMEPGGGSRVDEDGNETKLPAVAPWKKIAVALAGAVGNMILAFALAGVIWWQGKPATLRESSNLVGYVSTNSVAYTKGIRVGDRVLQVRAQEGADKKEAGIFSRFMSKLTGTTGEPIWHDTVSWQDVMIEASLAQYGADLRIEKPDGEQMIVSLPTVEGALGVKGVRGLQDIDGIDLAEVGSVDKGSTAENAGVLPGDIITQFNGVKVFSRIQLSELVNSRQEQLSSMVVLRDGQEKNLQVIPQLDSRTGINRARIGVMFTQFSVDKTTLVHPPPMLQIRQHASIIFRTLRALITPREAGTAAKQIGGAPAIFEYLWFTLRAGIIMALSFTCLLNVNLAIINLMPVPVLDGGHIVFALIEMIARRPLHEKVVSSLTMLFAIVLISAMLFLSVRDVDRMIDRRRTSKESEPVESGKVLEQAGSDPVKE